MPVPSGSSILPSFATPTDLTFRLRRDVDTDAAQANLDDASAEIRAAIHQDISLVTADSVVLRVEPNSSRLTLPQRPASNPASITLSTTGALAAWYWDGIDTVSLVPLKGFVPWTWDNSWRWDNLWTDIPHALASYWGVPSVTVVYDHGSNDADWLHVAKSVCLSAAVRMYDNPTGDKQEAIDDYSRTRATAGDQGILTAGEIRRLKATYGRLARSTALSSIA